MVSSAEGVVLLGLLLAGLGHLLLHDFMGAARAWRRADDRFPPALRSSAGLAGRTLLAIGALLVLGPVVG